jgi:hypothetical protein
MALPIRSVALSVMPMHELGITAGHFTLPPARRRPRACRELRQPHPRSTASAACVGPGKERHARHEMLAFERVHPGCVLNL